MNLVEVVAVYPPYRSGIGAVARDNARMAAEGGWNVTVCTPMYPSLRTRAKRSEMHNRVCIERLQPLLSYGNAAVMRGLFSRLKKADRIHLHYPCIGSEWIVALAAALYRKKLFITYHHDLIGKGMFRLIFSLYTALVLPIMMRIAHHVFVTSQDYADQSQCARYLKGTKGKYSVLPCAVDTNTFFPRDKNERVLTRLNIPPCSTVILFVGGLDDAHYFKGVDLLIDAFAPLVQSFSHCHLVIVGDGNLKNQYKEHAARLSCGNHIHFAGSVSDEELPLYYASADVCVLPSLDESEAFGIALIEARACAKPVIASRIRGVRSVVRDGVDGILISPRSCAKLTAALAALLADAGKSSAMGRAARKNCEEQYAFEHIGKIFVNHLL